MIDIKCLACGTAFSIASDECPHCGAVAQAAWDASETTSVGADAAPGARVEPDAVFAAMAAAAEAASNGTAAEAARAAEIARAAAKALTPGRPSAYEDGEIFERTAVSDLIVDDVRIDQPASLGPSRSSSMPKAFLAGFACAAVLFGDVTAVAIGGFALLHRSAGREIAHGSSRDLRASVGARIEPPVIGASVARSEKAASVLSTSPIEKTVPASMAAAKIEKPLITPSAASNEKLALTAPTPIFGTPDAASRTAPVRSAAAPANRAPSTFSVPRAVAVQSAPSRPAPIQAAAAKAPVSANPRATGTPDSDLPWEEPSEVAAAAASAPKLAAAPPTARVIHSHGGDKSVAVNKNIALTSRDGHTFVGKLLDVENGFVDVKTSSSRVRIAEKDVQDAATY